MSLSTNKIILAGAQSNTAGAYFLTTTVTAVSTGNGTGCSCRRLCDASTSQYVYSWLTTVHSTATVLPANTGGVIISDGVNVYAKQLHRAML